MSEARYSYLSDGSPMWTCKICGKAICFDVDKNFDVCKEHLEGFLSEKHDKEVKRRKKELESLGTISNPREIVCPYCFNEIERSWEYGFDDEDVEDMECPHCEKEFTVETVITKKYISTRKEK